VEWNLELRLALFTYFIYLISREVDCSYRYIMRLNELPEKGNLCYMYRYNASLYLSLPWFTCSIAPAAEEFQKYLRRYVRTKVPTFLMLCVQGGGFSSLNFSSFPKWLVLKYLRRDV